MEHNEFMKLWNEFSDIPLDENECIDEDFHFWPKGTDRYEIWYWFEELSPNGIVELLYGKEEQKDQVEKPRI